MEVCRSGGYADGAPRRRGTRFRAAHWGDGAEFLHTDGVSQEAAAAFYGQLGAGDAGAIHIVIADGAGFHLPEGHELLL